MLKATVSRLDQRIMTVTFRADRRVEPTVVTAFDDQLVGMRYFPDFSQGALGKPAVHDLVAMNLVELEIAEAWSGEAPLTFGRSEKEELYHLEPLRMLESYYITGFTYVNQGTTTIHDYLA